MFLENQHTGVSDFPFRFPFLVVTKIHSHLQQLNHKLPLGHLFKTVIVSTSFGFSKPNSPM
jgi:FMN phosphatase YigB (HAD superfamily)